MPNLDLLTIGDCSIDLFMKVPDNAPGIETGSDKTYFKHGQKIMVESFQSSTSGNSVNVGVGAKMLGLNVGIYSETGDDSNSDKIEKRLKDEGIDTTFLVKNKGVETALHAVIVFSGERTIFSYHGKRDYKLQNWGKPKFIYYTSIGEGFEKFQKELVEYKKGSDVGLVFNPGTFQMTTGASGLKNILEVTDILIVNKEEAVKLTSGSAQDEYLDLHTKLQKHGPKLTVITDAEHGSTAHDGKTLFKQDIFSDNKPIVDMTGAGDAFAAGFMSAIVYGKSLDEALKWGAINSSAQIKVVGSVDGMLTRNELEKLL